MGTLKVNGNIEASSILKLNGDWENDFGILLQEGGGASYGAFIKYGLNDYLTIGTRNADSDVVAIKIYRGDNSITVNGSVTATSFIGSLSGNASTATYATSAGSANSVAWSGVTGKPSTFTPSSGSNHYIKVYNSSNVGDANGVTVDTLASQGFAVAMLNGATNNPLGAAKWIHCLNMPWGAGDNDNWISQLAFGVENSDGIWYRTNAYTAINKPWKRILDSNNYNSYTVTKTGGGASGTWGINISGKAEYANYINTVAGNEIRFHNATGLTAGGTLWLGWAWADGNKTVTKDWYIGNFSGGGLANIYASTFNGTLNGNATSATYVKDSYNGSNITITYGKSGQSSTSWLASWNGYELGAIQPSSITAGWASGASYSNSSNALASTGWGNGNFTYLQTSGDFYGNSGWSHYLISNHGSGETYYNYVICLPFWSYPKYKRMSGGSAGSWYNFYTTENVIIQSSTPGAGFYGQIWFKI